MPKASDPGTPLRSNREVARDPARSVASEHRRGDARRASRTPVVVFMWEQFATYHIDRIEAVTAAVAGRFDVVGVEVAAHSTTYAWKPVSSGNLFKRHVLFPNAVAEQIPWFSKLRRSLSVILSQRPKAVFLCDYDHPEILVALLVLRILGISTYALVDAKFDDRPRRALPEFLKGPILRLFRGGIAGGARHLDYARFLGLPENWGVIGYSAVSVQRLRGEAGVALAPNGVPFADRDFVVVARFVSKKDIRTAIEAYAAYRRMRADSRRQLILCGSGPQEEELRSIAPDGVKFTGFLDSTGVSQTVARGLALILPSLQEPWGLVVNEAIALNIPVLCSDNVGARDTLVRTGVNGFIFEPGNVEGLARLMGFLSDDETLWREMSSACERFAPLADADAFACGVVQLIDGNGVAAAR